MENKLKVMLSVMIYDGVELFQKVTMYLLFMHANFCYSSQQRYSHLSHRWSK